MTLPTNHTYIPRPLTGGAWIKPVIPSTNFQFPLHTQLPLLSAAMGEAQNNIQAPRAMIFGCALTAIALSQQGLINVRKPNGQEVPTSVMLLTIGDSGERKSTVENAFFHAIREFEREQRLKYLDQVRGWQVAHEIWSAQRKDLMKNAAKKAGTDSAAEEKKILDHDAKEPIKPKEFKIIYEDSTTEALLLGLYKNLPTAGLISSEGGGVLQGRALRDLFKPNALWSGDDITVNRKDAESYGLTGARLTVSIMVQKSAYDRFMENRGEESRGSGLWARFFVAMPASTQGLRFVKNGTQSWEHLKPFADRIRERVEQNVALLDHSEKDKDVVAFSPEASERWFDVLNAIEAEIRPGGRFEFAGDHASKLADNIARMAAHFHQFEGFEGDISRDTLELAIDTSFWFSNEFLRLFVPPPQEVLDSQELISWLCQLQMNGHRYIRKNHIRQFGPNKLRDKRRLQAALDLLCFNRNIALFPLGKAHCVDLSPWLPFDPVAAQAVIFGGARAGGS